MSVDITFRIADLVLPTYKKGDNITLQIMIKDTGIGIPHDKFDEIFEHFSRLTSSYQGVYKGSGLAIRAELHRCIGGVVYLKLPQLEQTLRAFQAAVKAEPQNPANLEKTYADLQHAFQAFWRACKAF